MISKVFDRLIEIGFAIPEVKPSCKDPLGMESGLIPNSAITASSMWSAAYGPENGRLNYKGGTGRYGGWFAAKNDHSQWLQVNFGRETKVTGIATQGYYNKLRYVKSYTLQYSHDGIYFQQYQPESHTKVKVCSKFFLVPLFFWGWWWWEVGAQMI